MNLSELRASGYSGINSVDEDKVNEIASNLRHDGWVGAPLVTCMFHLVTGSHRFEALKSSVEHDFEVPTIELSEIFASESMDLDEVMEEEDCTEPWGSGFVFVLDQLSVETREFYGIQY